MAPSKIFTKRPRLNRHDWVMAGFEALSEGGAQDIRIEALARKLGATKGSFYWHFADLPELQREILTLWATMACQPIALETSPERATQQLFKLVEQVAGLAEGERPDEQIEPALRAWARTHDLAKETVQKVDKFRLGQLQHSLEAVGLIATEAQKGAEMFYSALIGLDELRQSTDISLHSPLHAIMTAAVSRVQLEAMDE